jgi:hypothetical protein
MSRPLPERSDKTHGHIVIAGTGRAGTTLLVQILTHLRFDTGFSPERALTRLDRTAHAGLEQPLTRIARWPYVVKKPMLSLRLGGLLGQGKLKVRSVILPVRALGAAAASRRRIWAEGGPRGGLWLLREGQSQEEALLEISYRLMLTIAEHGLPHLLIGFPRFARDAAYAWRQLGPLLAEHGVVEAEFAAAHAACARADLIHDFGPEPGGGEG